MKYYDQTSRRGFTRKHERKIRPARWLGVDVPFVVLAVCLQLSPPISFSPALNISVLLLVATLVGTAATLSTLNALLAPIRITSSSLQEYLDSKRIPSLPIGFTDEAGRLMADVQYAVD